MKRRILLVTITLLIAMLIGIQSAYAINYTHSCMYCIYQFYDYDAPWYQTTASVKQGYSIAIIYSDYDKALHYGQSSGYQGRSCQLFSVNCPSRPLLLTDHPLLIDCDNSDLAGLAV